MSELKGQLKGQGMFDGKTHVLPISIYYEDTDLSGMVYHANYLRYMERGRTEFFRLAGISRANLDAEEPTAWSSESMTLSSSFYGSIASHWSWPTQRASGRTPKT